MVNEATSQTDDIEYIEIRYRPGVGDPARVFRSMARLIESVYRIEQDLVGSLTIGIEPQLVLERVEAGSIRAVLRRLLTQVDDDALKGLDWKPLIGQYLVRGKHRLLRWLNGRNRIQDRSEVIQLQQDLVGLVPPPAAAGHLFPRPVPTNKLLADVQSVAEAVRDLETQDEAIYVAGGESTTVNKSFSITPEDIEDLLTEESVSNTAEMILLIKKPDYLGSSRWEFRLGDHTVEAKIVDEEWLERFRNREFPLAPGDALRARVRTELRRGFENSVVSTHHYVEKVYEVRRGSAATQLPLADDEGT